MAIDAQPQPGNLSMSEDVVERVAEIAPDSGLAALRHRREEGRRFSQGSYDVLLLPEDPGGLSREERATAALQVALMNEDDALAAHYRALLPVESQLKTARAAALSAHVERVARTPGAAKPADLQALQAVGLAVRDIVVLSQLIAFVSYQARLLAGLRLLQQEAAA